MHEFSQMQYILRRQTQQRNELRRNAVFMESTSETSSNSTSELLSSIPHEELVKHSTSWMLSGERLRELSEP
jgi:hypothetical protein